MWRGEALAEPVKEMNKTNSVSRAEETEDLKMSIWIRPTEYLSSSRVWASIG